MSNFTLPTADSWYRKPSQDSAPVCINTDISPEMAAQSAQRSQAFCVTASLHQHDLASKKMAAPMEVTHKLLDGSSTSSGTVFWGVSLAITQ